MSVRSTRCSSHEHSDWLVIAATIIQTGLFLLLIIRLSFLGSSFLRFKTRLLSFHSAPHAYILIEDELPSDVDPTLMMR